MASGNSISDGIKLGLSNYLEREVVFGINDDIKFIWPTVAMFGDWTAYASRFELYKQHPLVIGRYDTHFTHKIEGAIPCPKQDDLIFFRKTLLTIKQGFRKRNSIYLFQI